jgi:hypothetical protein
VCLWAREGWHPISARCAKDLLHNAQPLHSPDSFIEREPSSANASLAPVSTAADRIDS